MTSIKSKSFRIKKQFSGFPKTENFEIVEKTHPPLSDDEFLIQCLYLSIDPYLRVYAASLKEGAAMVGSGVGRVIESKNSKYPTDTIITGPFGWCTHLVPDVALLNSKLFQTFPSDMPPSYALGVLGLTGANQLTGLYMMGTFVAKGLRKQLRFTAYFGLLDICSPQLGETVFVNTAAGAVGNVVGQIAKIKGCRVVGSCGSDEKVEYLKELGFDGAFNYKTTTKLEEKLRELCPKGIDCFFDNVGGESFDVSLKLMNRNGRVALCGYTSAYNSNDPNSIKGPYVHMHAIHKEIKIQGFNTPSFYGKYDEATAQLTKWIQEEKLQVKEDIVEGFENTPKAFISLLSGENIGKALVKV